MKYKIPNYKRPSGVTSISQSALEDIRMEERSVGFLFALCIACNTLRDLPDPFGPTRMNRFLERFAVKMNCVAERYISPMEMMNILVDEVGIDLQNSDIKKAMPGLSKYVKDRRKST